MSPDSAAVIQLHVSMGQGDMLTAAFCLVLAAAGLCALRFVYKHMSD